jgi:hypothetical protein
MGGLDEDVKAGLLAPRSSYLFGLTAMIGSPSDRVRSGWLELSSLVTAAKPPGIPKRPPLSEYTESGGDFLSPGSLFSHGLGHRHFGTVYTIYGISLKELHTV